MMDVYLAQQLQHVLDQGQLNGIQGFLAAMMMVLSMIGGFRFGRVWERSSYEQNN